MLARRLTTILPDLTLAEALDTTARVSGLLRLQAVWIYPHTSREEVSLWDDTSTSFEIFCRSAMPVTYEVKLCLSQVLVAEGGTRGRACTLFFLYAAPHSVLRYDL